VIDCSDQLEMNNFTDELRPNTQKWTAANSLDAEVFEKVT
jgi:hypothetical protein